MFTLIEIWLDLLCFCKVIFHCLLWILILKFAILLTLNGQISITSSQTGDTLFIIGKSKIGTDYNIFKILWYLKFWVLILWNFEIWLFIFYDIFRFLLVSVVRWEMTLITHHSSLTLHLMSLLCFTLLVDSVTHFTYLNFSPLKSFRLHFWSLSPFSSIIVFFKHFRLIWKFLKTLL